MYEVTTMQKLFEISGLNIYMQIAVTLISFGVHAFLQRKKENKESLISLAAVYTIGLSGWFMIMSGLFGHIIYADSVAQSIGWPLNSGFQMELGFAAIGIGLTGFIGFWKRSFWLPYIIARTSFLLGAGVTHIIHIAAHGNFSPSNAGVVLYWDFIFPVILIALFIFYKKDEKKTLKKEN